jgi:hypothetical protein
MNRNITDYFRTSLLRIMEWNEAPDTEYPKHECHGTTDRSITEKVREFS